MNPQQKVRHNLADAIEFYLDGEYTNAQLEDVIFDIWGVENVSTNIADVIILFSSDFATHRNSGRYQIPSKFIERIRKWIVFLRSDCNWPASARDILAGDSSETIRGQAIEDVHWPFQSKDDWDKYILEMAD
tara:strand:+ start:5237 stop:5632 length:396 start_codon:yes stop_codon:yes gene_type:complete